MLHITEVRHNVIAQNLANVNTPGFVAREVPFEEEMGRMRQEGNGRVRSPEDLVRDAVATQARQDGNTVDINREVSNLNRNALMHQAYLQILANKMSQMRSAITGK